MIQWDRRSTRKGIAASARGPAAATSHCPSAQPVAPPRASRGRRDFVVGDAEIARRAQIRATSATNVSFPQSGEIPMNKMLLLATGLLMGACTYEDYCSQPLEDCIDACESLACVDRCMDDFGSGPHWTHPSSGADSDTSTDASGGGSGGSDTGGGSGGSDAGGSGSGGSGSGGSGSGGGVTDVDAGGSVGSGSGSGGSGSGSGGSGTEPDCLRSSDCTTGACVDGACVAECTVDEQCGAGRVCADGVCVVSDDAPPPVECVRSADCAGGGVCIDATCRAACVCDGDCGDAESCRFGGCVADPDRACARTSDCFDGEACVDGTCRVAD